MESKNSLFCLRKEDYLETVQKLIKSLLEAVGENPEREGLQDTPLRVAKMYRETLKGYCEEENPKITIFNNEEGYTEMIIDEGYFYSMCEHHMMPFFGKVYVAYIPDKKIIGISKLARVVDHYAARLQVQERLTQQVAAYLQEVLQPRGVAVVMHARHLCREMRGIKKLNAHMTTSELLGVFKEDAKTRAEFLGLVQNKLKD